MMESSHKSAMRDSMPVWLWFVIAALLLALAGSSDAQVRGKGSPGTPPAQILTSGTSFTTALNIPAYKVIVIGPGGGGGSSSGVGVGGSGASGSITSCDVQGGGLTYTYAIGAGGAKGTAGLSGSAGTSSSFADATNCAATSGNGGTAGTASAGAGGTAGVAPGAALMVSGNNAIGHALALHGGVAGSTGSAFQPNTLGVGQGGAGCGGANCTTNTNGTNGEIIVIPQNY